MLLTCGHPYTKTYRVEVSGWDCSHTFFVEKAELSWNEENGKQVTLTHALCPGTMIFVRLLLPISADRSAPVAYQAEQVATTPEGFRQFHLKRAEPRSVAKEVSQ
jgi:hypothetical protein